MDGAGEDKAIGVASFVTFAKELPDEDETVTFASFVEEDNTAGLTDCLKDELGRSVTKLVKKSLSVNIFRCRGKIPVSGRSR